MRQAIYRLHPEAYDEEVESFLARDRHGDPFGFDMMSYTRSTRESKELNFLREPAVIISASGMAEAGRILHHLKNNIEDPRNTILIVGWQAPHTLGRRIVEKQPEVKIFGETYKLRARVEVINGLSAHADRSELTGVGRAICVSHRRTPHTFIVHGEEDAPQSSRWRMDPFASQIEPHTHGYVWKCGHAVPRSRLHQSFESCLSESKTLDGPYHGRFHRRCYKSWIISKWSHLQINFTGHLFCRRTQMVQPGYRCLMPFPGRPSAEIWQENDDRKSMQDFSWLKMGSNLTAASQASILKECQDLRFTERRRKRLSFLQGYYWALRQWSSWSDAQFFAKCIASANLISSHCGPRSSSRECVLCRGARLGSQWPWRIRPAQKGGG